MARYIVALASVLAVTVSSIHGQCVPRCSNNYASCNVGPVHKECQQDARTAAGELTAAHGGGFPVTSASPTPPHGVSVVSDNEYSGVLAVLGQLPFLGTTHLEGAVPSAGAGAVTYGCGYGDVAIVSEELPGSATSLGYTHGLVSDRGANGYRGCGCGTLY